uniref:ENOD40-1 protein n=1 Tax=Lotus japonicus TaxID=34305 RepID=Q9M433_LOTJA|nr:ENOD40-1 protein [Lotus japonicus]
MKLCWQISIHGS